MHKQTIKWVLLTAALFSSGIYLFLAYDPEPWHRARVQAMGVWHAGEDWLDRSTIADFDDYPDQPREFMRTTCFANASMPSAEKRKCLFGLSNEFREKAAARDIVRVGAWLLVSASVVAAMAGVWIRRRRLRLEALFRENDGPEAAVPEDGASD